VKDPVRLTLVQRVPTGTQSPLESNAWARRLVASRELHPPNLALHTSSFDSVDHVLRTLNCTPFGRQDSRRSRDVTGHKYRRSGNFADRQPRLISTATSIINGYSTNYEPTLSQRFIAISHHSNKVFRVLYFPRVAYASDLANLRPNINIRIDDPAIAPPKPCGQSQARTNDIQRLSCLLIFWCAYPSISPPGNATSGFLPV
jgi:hypothetical protein